LAAELNEPSAENSFGICLERGIGVCSNVTLAVRYYKRAAAHGDPDGANNLGFCLEHGRGVKQDIHAAVECYKFAHDHGHPEGELNYRRCLRVLERWTAPDRSSRISDHSTTVDSLTRLFLGPLENPKVRSEFADSIKQLKSLTKVGRAPRTEWATEILAKDGYTTVTLEIEPDEVLTAVKTAKYPTGKEEIQREVAILKRLDHPLIVQVRRQSLDPVNGYLSLVTEFPLNGSLADHLSGAKQGNLC
jgi:hypothetical protein